MPPNKARASVNEIRETIASLGTGYLFGDFDSEDDEFAADAVFEYESMIAGLAETICNSENLTASHRDLLEPEILQGTMLRLMQEPGAPDKLYDIGHLQSVLLQAQKIEKIRQLCIRFLTGLT